MEKKLHEHMQQGCNCWRVAWQANRHNAQDALEVAMVDAVNTTAAASRQSSADSKRSMSLLLLLTQATRSATAGATGAE
jgi:hypothetical protein